MSEQITSVVDQATNIFCADGMASGRIVVPVPSTPNTRLHRYSGDPVNPIRDATAQEIADMDAATRAQAIAAQVAALITPQQLTFVIWALTNQLGHPPTAQDLATAKAQLASIYKALP